MNRQAPGPEMPDSTVLELNGEEDSCYDYEWLTTGDEDMTVDHMMVDISVVEKLLPMMFYWGKLRGRVRVRNASSHQEQRLERTREVCQLGLWPDSYTA